MEKRLEIDGFGCEELTLDESVTTSHGVMVVNSDGLAWAKTYQDGRCTECGWVRLSMGEIHNPTYCKKPTDVVHKGHYMEKEISMAKLVSVTVTSVVTVKASNK